MDMDCRFRLLTGGGGGKSLRHPTQNKTILQGEQIIRVPTVTLRRIGRSSELLDYSLLEALLRVYSFEFEFYDLIQQGVMNQSQEVYSQFASYLDGNHFNYLACEYDGDKYAKHF